MKIVMVCLGNICRSPLAEGIMQAKTDENNLQIIVDSAGTANYHVGQQPDSRSIEVARKYGIDISKQKARQFKKEDFKEFDLIYVMDASNLSDVISLASNNEEINKVKLILNEINPKENLDVPDPYYGGEDGFETVYQLLDEACDVIVKNIRP